MLHDFKSRFLKFFLNKSKGEALISFILAAVVFFALAFGVIEVGMLAYQDFFMNDKLESIGKNAESSSELFLNVTAIDLINYNRTYVKCSGEEDPQIECGYNDDSDNWVADDNSEEAFGDNPEYTRKDYCKFWKKLYTISKKSLDGVSQVEMPDTSYVISKKNSKCTSKVAILLPGFELTDLAARDDSSNSSDKEDVGVRTFEATSDADTYTVLQGLKLGQGITTTTNIVKNTGLFTFFTDEKFNKSLIQVVKPRVNAISSTCPEGQVHCGDFCCQIGFSCIRGACCDNVRVCDNECCTDDENCIPGDDGRRHCCLRGTEWADNRCCDSTRIYEDEGKKKCCGHDMCSDQCCDPNQECLNYSICCDKNRIYDNGTKCCSDDKKICENKTSCCDFCINDVCCPAERLYDNNTKCCSSEDRIYEENGVKKCCDIKVTNGVCCPSSKPYLVNNNTCCPNSDDVATNGVCCPSSKPYLVNNNTCCPNSDDVATNGVCCSSAKPYLINGTTCCENSDDEVTNGVCCPKSKPYLINGNTCCPNSDDKVTNGICCPSGVDYNSVTNDCCPSDKKYFKNSICCPNQTDKEINGVCCPEDKQCGSVCCGDNKQCSNASLGACCEVGEVYTSSDKTCCDSTKAYENNTKCCSSDLCGGKECCDTSTDKCISNAKCCPKTGYTYTAGDDKCCPTGQVYTENGVKKCCEFALCGTKCCEHCINGGCCPEDRLYDNGNKCCTPADTRVLCGPNTCCRAGYRCEDPDVGLCCGGNTTPCGTKCCAATKECKDPENSVCCDSDVNSCGDQCCVSPGYFCIDPATHKCCKNSTDIVVNGNCCPVERQCGDGKCCTAGQVCKDKEKGLCCASTFEACGTACCSTSTGYKCENEEMSLCCKEELGCGTKCCASTQECTVKEASLCCSKGSTPYKNNTACCASGKEVCKDDLCCTTGTCCGEKCCSAGYTCQRPFSGATSTDGLCCPGTRVGCGTKCCNTGQVCANEATELCCNEGLEGCGTKCCAAGKVCKVEATGLCCNEGETPYNSNKSCCPAGRAVCNDQCCAAGLVCDTSGSTPKCAVRPTDTPSFDGDCCPSGYVCKKYASKEAMQCGENAESNCATDGDGEATGGCCKEENFYEDSNYSTSPLCCDNNQTPFYSVNSIGVTTYECKVGCPSGTVDAAFADGVEHQPNEHVCCPSDVPVVQGYGQYTGVPVCCKGSDVFCGGGCCSSGNNCAPIKGSMQALEAVPGGLDVKEFKTCCPVKQKTEFNGTSFVVVRDGNGNPIEIPQVFCGGGCCDEDRCISPNGVDEYAKISYSDFVNTNRTQGWLAALGLFNTGTIMSAYQCCPSPNEVYTMEYSEEGSAIKDCCDQSTKDDDDELVYKLLNASDEEGRDIQICCDKDNVYPVDGEYNEEGEEEACCEGTLGVFEITQEGGNASNQTNVSSDNNTNTSTGNASAGSNGTNSNGTNSSGTNNETNKKTVYKCCEEGQTPYLDSNNTPQCCSSGDLIDGLCCPSERQYTQNGTKKCCPSGGQIYTNSNNKQACCENVTTPQNGSNSGTGANNIVRSNTSPLTGEVCCDVTSGEACGSSCCSLGETCITWNIHDSGTYTGVCCTTGTDLNPITGNCCDDDKPHYVEDHGCCTYNYIDPSTNKEKCCPSPLCNGICCGEGQSCQNGECKEEDNEFVCCQVPIDYYEIVDGRVQLKEDRIVVAANDEAACLKEEGVYDCSGPANKESSLIEQYGYHCCIGGKTGHPNSEPRDGSCLYYEHTALPWNDPRCCTPKTNCSEITDCCGNVCCNGTCCDEGQSCENGVCVKNEYVDLSLPCCGGGEVIGTYGGPEGHDCWEYVNKPGSLCVKSTQMANYCCIPNTGFCRDRYNECGSDGQVVGKCKPVKNCTNSSSERDLCGGSCENGTVVNAAPDYGINCEDHFECPSSNTCCTFIGGTVPGKCDKSDKYNNNSGGYCGQLKPGMTALE